MYKRVTLDLDMEGNKKPLSLLFTVKTLDKTEMILSHNTA